MPYRSPGGALYRFPGPRPSDNGSHVDAFEGFARSFLLAAFRIPLAEPGRADQLADRYAAGIAAGTAGREAWPRLSGLTQPLVEASAVALGLLQTMPSVWPRLGEAARQRLVDYLLDARDAPRPTGNWMWFQIVIELFLAAAGAGRFCWGALSSTVRRCQRACGPPRCSPGPVTARPDGWRQSRRRRSTR